MTPPRRPQPPPGRRRDEDDDGTVVPFRRSTISEARAYTPRGSTIRETAQRDAAQRGETPTQDKNVPAPRAPGSRITRPRGAEAPPPGSDGRAGGRAEQPRRSDPQRGTDPSRGAAASGRGDAGRRAEPRRAEPARRAEPSRPDAAQRADAARRAEPRPRPDAARRAEPRPRPDAAQRADGARRADPGAAARRTDPNGAGSRRPATPAADRRGSAGRGAESRSAAPRRTEPRGTTELRGAAPLGATDARTPRSSGPRGTTEPRATPTRGSQSRSAARDAAPRRAADARAAGRDAAPRRAADARPTARDTDQRRAATQRASSRDTDSRGSTRRAGNPSGATSRTNPRGADAQRGNPRASTSRSTAARSEPASRGTAAGRSTQKPTKAGRTTTPRTTTPRTAAPRTTTPRTATSRTTPTRTSTANRSTGLARKPVRPKRPVGKAPRRPRRLRVPRLGDPARRLRFATAVILLLFGVLAGRLVQIQASDGATYAALAATGRMTVPLTIHAPRGAILDRAGNPLAVSVDAVAVDADPSHAKDPAATARALTALIGVPESRLVGKLARKKNEDGDLVRFVYLARGLDPEVGQAVKSLKLAGINVRKEQRRDVPSHDLAANIVGFTGWDGNGQAGIEASYDDVLRGVDGSRQYETGRNGEEIPDGLSKETPAKPGRDVMLTIDRDLQYETLRMLSSRIRAIGAYNGTAVVLDVRTGEILAMASYPTYDAAKPGSSTESTRVDLATGSVLEPGSVHKAITIGAGLQEGVIKPDSVLTIGPTIRKGSQTFRDSHSHPVRGFTLMGILAQSSNVGTITIADKLGADKLYEYQRKFGLGSKTGIGVPGESAGLVQPPSRWSDPSYGTIPIGLGVAVTPLQMTSVYATIANDGVRITPTLVKATENADGTTDAAARPKTERVLSAANARALRTDLEAVPTKFGTAKKAAVPGYRVAGKTGTGKRTQNSKYMPGDVSSFIGMVPADSPRYVIGVFTHGPGGSGAQVSAPAFSELAGFTLRHYGVAPSGSPPPPIRIYGG